MERPVVWSMAELEAASLPAPRLWATASARALAESRLRLTASPAQPGALAAVSTLLVIGGGKLIDEGKAARRRHAPGLRLVVVPSIWGSGAESSPIVVLDRDGGKRIDRDPENLPDVRVDWPELVAQVPAERARAASGDVWAHALEAFTSPLADEAARAEAAALIGRLLALPLGYHPDWMEHSRAACRLQARTSVGLVHGIAHTLEGPLHAAEPGFGHARLCALYLWPVLSFCRQASPKWSAHFEDHGVDADAVLARVRELFSQADYRRLLPVLATSWARVLRDPCTRTNVSMVRPRALGWFEAFEAA